MTQVAKKRNQARRDAGEMKPFEVYKATRPHTQNHNNRSINFIHIATEPIRDKFGIEEKNADGDIIRSKGVSFKLPKAKQQSTKRV